MIGVALVVFAAVFATSASKSIGDALDKTFAGDLVVANADGFSPISPDVGTEMADLDGVETVSPISGAPAIVDLPAGSSQEILSGLDPSTLTNVAKLDWVDGDDETLQGLGAQDAIVESQWAEDNDVSVGDTLSVSAADGESVDINIVGSVRDRIQLLVPGIALPIDTIRSRFAARDDFADLVGFVPGADFAGTRSVVDDLLERRFPEVEARSQGEYKQEQEDLINQLLALIYVLLALSV